MVIFYWIWWWNWGKTYCVQLIAINKELPNFLTTVLFCLVLGKQKLKFLLASSELYLVFWSIYSIQGTEEKPYSLVLLTVVGCRVGYQAWQEFYCVWLGLVCNGCLGQSGIWTTLDGELWVSISAQIRRKYACTVTVIYKPPQWLHSLPTLPLKDTEHS